VWKPYGPQSPDEWVKKREICPRCGGDGKIRHMAMPTVWSLILILLLLIAYALTFCASGPAGGVRTPRTAEQVLRARIDSAEQLDPMLDSAIARRDRLRKGSAEWDRHDDTVSAILFVVNRIINGHGKEGKAAFLRAWSGRQVDTLALARKAEKARWEQARAERVAQQERWRRADSVFRDSVARLPMETIPLLKPRQR
jgi:hypothetical protein